MINSANPSGEPGEAQITEICEEHWTSTPY
jgi:hypothetical protein